MKLSTMYTKATKQEPSPGKEQGTCCICHQQTRQGHKKRLGTTFTTTDQTSRGDVICPYCMTLKKDSNKLRRTMWILTEDKFHPFKRPELPQILKEPPDKPYYLYLTRTYKKIGWIIMDGLLNQPNQNIIRLACDMETHTLSRELAVQTIEWINELREKYRISKTEMKTGDVNPGKLQDMTVREARNLNITLNKLKGNPTWELLIDMA